MKFRHRIDGKLRPHNSRRAPDEEIENMMYEEDRYWNMDELTEWNDEYVIKLGDESHEQQEYDEEKEEAMMLTNLEC